MELAFNIFNLGVLLHSLVSMLHYKRGGCYRRALYMARVDETFKPYVKIHKPLWSPIPQLLIYPGWLITSGFTGYLLIVLGLIVLAVVITHGFYKSAGKEDSTSFVSMSELNAFATEFLFVLVTGFIFLNW